MFNISTICLQWQPIIYQALSTMDQSYLNHLQQQDWLPGATKLFNAFSLPLHETQFILMGESPYPRSQSANGYAFWDGAVHQLWSESGLSTAVNRATSLRNFIKMLLYAGGYLSNDFSQPAIARLDKAEWVQTADELFQNLLTKGFLLLNASLVLSDAKVQYDARAWQPFMTSLLEQLYQIKPSLKLLLFGKIATKIDDLCSVGFEKLVAEHPYNISFITNPDVVTFFEPLNLLSKSG